MDKLKWARREEQNKIQIKYDKKLNKLMKEYEDDRDLGEIYKRYGND